MGTQPSDPDGIIEYCQHCGDETVHRVRIELRTESSTEENAEFSREPYRITVCEECEAKTTQRMNNA